MKSKKGKKRHFITNQKLLIKNIINRSLVLQNLLSQDINFYLCNLEICHRIDYFISNDFPSLILFELDNYYRIF